MGASAIVRRGLRLEYLTIGWNSLEAMVGITAGLIAGSIALVGFGLDSIIEVSSGAILLWRLRAEHRGSGERAEVIAVRLVGVSLLALAAYVAYDSITSLVHRNRPETSVPGVVLAIASLAVMPILAHAKRKVARGLNSRAMQADSRQTDICAYLSAILLGGLTLNAILGWWWADPAAALAMVPLIAEEGIEAAQGRTCCESGNCVRAKG